MASRPRNRRDNGEDVEGYQRSVQAARVALEYGSGCRGPAATLGPTQRPAPARSSGAVQRDPSSKRRAGESIFELGDKEHDQRVRRRDAAGRRNTALLLPKSRVEALKIRGCTLERAAARFASISRTCNSSDHDGSDRNYVQR